MNVLAAGDWIFDAVFFVLLLLGMLIGCWRGFVKGVCKLAGTIFALFVAVTCCNAFKNSLESWFGMTSAIAKGFGATDAAYTAASWVSVAIAFVLLFLLVKVLSWLLGNVGKGLVERSKALTTVDRILGALLGLLQAVLLIFLLLTICYWIPSESLHESIRQGGVVGAIYDWKWFQWAAEFRFLK